MQTLPFVEGFCRGLAAGLAVLALVAAVDANASERWITLEHELRHCNGWAHP